MVCKVENLSEEQLETVRRQIGEAFVTNALFHNWGTPEERREDVLKYIASYVDYVYRAGELYANEDLTGFIGLEDSHAAPKLSKFRMLYHMLAELDITRVKSLLHYIKQINGSYGKYNRLRHLDVLMVCVDKAHQGRGEASELVNFAKQMADEKGLALIFGTDMKEYAEMYLHFGCKLYNKITADNGVTRYCLCYEKEQA